jgi:negative regulator of sigma-B (phosphoserine phosphatase)
METVDTPLLEYGVAKFVLPGQTESGDHYVIRCNQNGVLIAAIDGIGHGEEAASAARTAASILTDSLNEPVIALVETCHEKLRLTRGVVLSLASIETSHGMMTWLGVGNIQGVLLRCGGTRERRMQEVLLLRGGVVGSQLPPLQAAVLPVARGDTLVLATDGVRSQFVETLSALENPQHTANRVLERYRTGSDDALVLVVRLMGVCP